MFPVAGRVSETCGVNTSRNFVFGKMRRLLVGLIALILVVPARCLALRGLLARGAPLVVDVRVDAPAAAWALDVQECSARLRAAREASLSS